RAARSTKRASPPRATRWSNPWVHALVVLAALGTALWLVYGGALHAPFIFHDHPTIVENPSIEHLWPPVGDAVHPRPRLLAPRTPHVRPASCQLVVRHQLLFRAA